MHGHPRALVALAAIALTGAAPAAAGPGAPAAPPGMTTLSSVVGEAWSVSLDGPRVAIVMTEPAAGSPAISVRRMDGHGPVLGVRYRPAGNCKSIGCDGPPSVMLAGTQVALADGGAGNTEAWGTWQAAAAPGRARLIRDWHAFGPGAGNDTAYTNWARGRGLAGQGTVLVYGSKNGLMRFGATRSKRIAQDVLYVWTVNKRRIVVERPGHTLALLDPDGNEIRTYPAIGLPANRADVDAVVLQGNTLATIVDRRLAAYDATSGAARGTCGLRGSPSVLGFARDVLLYEPFVGQPRLLRLSDCHDVRLSGVPSLGMQLSERGLDAAGRARVRGKVGLTIVHVPWSGLRAVLGP